MNGRLVSSGAVGCVTEVGAELPAAMELNFVVSSLALQAALHATVQESAALFTLCLSSMNSKLSIALHCSACDLQLRWS